MERIVINGKEYLLDVEKCMELGLLYTEESKAIESLRKLVDLRDWWWDNVCGGWRPKYDGEEQVWRVLISRGPSYGESCNVLIFPTSEIRFKFQEAYKDLIEEAKTLL